VCKRGEQQQQDVVMAVVLMILGKQQQRVCGRWLPAVECMQAACQASTGVRSGGAFVCIDRLQQVLMHSFVCAFWGFVCVH
jgi:hypothetical protein